MGLRQWLRKRMMEEDRDDERDLPPPRTLMHAIMGREEQTPHALGEYTAQTYPGELAGILRRRQEVTDALMGMELTSREGRREAVPRLHELLRKYPHPLAYETLIMAYVDQGRWDEARGVAFAARERREECRRSPHPEIRAETDRLREWSPEDVDVLRDEREGRVTTPGVVPATRPATA